MIRNMKALGLAFVAVAAMSMVVASAAQATQLHATVGPSAALTGQQTEAHRFELTKSGAVTQCAQATFEGTVQGVDQQQTTAQDATLTPTYFTCQTVGLASQVLMNGCKYTITGSHVQAQGTQTFSKTAWVDVVGCTSGKAIEIKLTGCTVTVPEQTTISHIVFSNIAEVQHLNGEKTPHDVEAQVTATGIAYEFHGIACPKPKDGQPVEVTKLTTDGVYTGKATFRAYQDLGTTQVTKHGHQYSEQKCGTQVGLIAT